MRELLRFYSLLASKCDTITVALDGLAESDFCGVLRNTRRKPRLPRQQRVERGWIANDDKKDGGSFRRRHSSGRADGGSGKRQEER